MNMDVTWSETGDRYMLKLFRDVLFHQVDERGAPWLDMAHVVQLLNKVRNERGAPWLDMAHVVQLPNNVRDGGA